jgi:hypothetical protein
MSVSTTASRRPDRKGPAAEISDAVALWLQPVERVDDVRAMAR